MHRESLDAFSPEHFLPDAFVEQVVELVVVVYLQVALVNIPGRREKVLQLYEKARMHMLNLVGAAFKH